MENGGDKSINYYDEIIQKFNNVGFSVMTHYTLETAYIVLERTVERNKTHQITLEDHRWEKAEKDFDPKRDVGDWLIFSCLTDDQRDYFGRFVETQYPLTFDELHLIEQLIYALEEKQQQL